MTELHKCAGCDRQIAVNYKFCSFCRSKLAHAGICPRCGERPRAPKPARGPWTQKCVECFKGTYVGDWSKMKFAQHPMVRHYTGGRRLE